MKNDAIDPKGLIADSFQMPGLGPKDCRAIFLDWALSLPAASHGEAVRRLLARHEAAPAGHPMRQVLTAALAAPPKPVRRGGPAGRRNASDTL